MVIRHEESWDNRLTNYVWDNAAEYEDENASTDLICCNKNLNVGHEHNTSEDEITALCITAILSICGTTADSDCLKREYCDPETFSKAIAKLSQKYLNVEVKVAGTVLIKIWLG